MNDLDVSDFARAVFIGAEGRTAVVMNPHIAITDEFMVAMLRRLIEAIEAGL